MEDVHVSLLKVRGLVKSYGRRRVVDGVDFEVDPGEIVGLLGPQRRRQDDHLPHDLRHDRSRRRPRHARRPGRHQLADVPPRQGRRHGLPGPGIERLPQALGAEESAGRDGNARHGPHAPATAAATSCWSSSASRSSAAAKALSLSGGERRRLEIARSLVSDPQIILLDEPFTGIDPVTIDSIQGIIRDLRDRGIAILITDHQVRETLEITDRSYVIRGGQVLCHGRPREVLNHPEARKYYFGEGMDVGLHGAA